MARRELSAAQLEVAHAVRALLPQGEVVVGCSGGADSLALAMGAGWAAARSGTRLRCVVVDHGLQRGSAAVAARVVEQLDGRGLPAQIRRITVSAGAGPEAAAREGRLAALARDGLPVLLGHTLDDQAESVLLGLLRGSGTRSLAGMAQVRGPFVRPLLGLRRATTHRACLDWGLDPWQDPHNLEPRFRRVQVRGLLEQWREQVGDDVAPALARTASLARLDADLLDELAADAAPEVTPAAATASVPALAALPGALRLRVLHRWLGPGTTHAHVRAVDALLSRWHGQGPVSVPGGSVARVGQYLRVDWG